MEAIKKKMQAMKVEKDNAMDRADACEESSKSAKIRAEKAQEEVADLMNKTRFKMKFKQVHYRIGRLKVFTPLFNNFNSVLIPVENYPRSLNLC